MSFSKDITIADRQVGPLHPTLVIAEAGVAHFGDVQKALDLVDMSAEAGADVFKTQAFHTDQLVSARLPEWRDRLRPKEVDFDFISRMKERCDERGIMFMCTPHEASVLPWLEQWQVPAIKIGSGERGNTPFFRQIAALGKPVILSTGMYAKEHVDQAVKAFSEAGQKELAVLHCVTSYPAPASDINLSAMQDLRKGFDGPVGYSDHTEGHHMCLAAVAMGADIIEKHITLDFNVPNAQDWKVSCGPHDFADFVKNIREVEAARGTGEKRPRKCEEPAFVWALKSLVAVQNLPVGHVITKADLDAKRPGDGISPSQVDEVIGKTLLQPVEKDQLIEWDAIK